MLNIFLQDLGSKDVNADAYLVAHIVRVGMWQVKTCKQCLDTGTFCTSQDTQVSYGWYLLIQGYFYEL